MGIWVAFAFAFEWHAMNDVDMRRLDKRIADGLSLGSLGFFDWQAVAFRFALVLLPPTPSDHNLWLQGPDRECSWGSRGTYLGAR